MHTRACSSGRRAGSWRAVRPPRPWRRSGRHERASVPAPSWTAIRACPVPRTNSSGLNCGRRRRPCCRPRASPTGRCCGSSGTTPSGVRCHRPPPRCLSGERVVDSTLSARRSYRRSGGSRRPLGPRDRSAHVNTCVIGRLSSDAASRRPVSRSRPAGRRTHRPCRRTSGSRRRSARELGRGGVVDDVGERVPPPGRLLADDLLRVEHPRRADLVAQVTGGLHVVVLVRRRDDAPGAAMIAGPPGRWSSRRGDRRCRS